MNAPHSMLRARALALAALAALATLIPAWAEAQTITYHYVAPIAAIRAAFGSVSTADTGFYDVGYVHVRITSANVAKFKAAAPKNLVKTYEAFQTGTPLRKRLDQILKISGGIVDVTAALVDDRTNISANSSFADAPRNDGSLYVWPAAGVSGKLANGRYRGMIGLGTSAADTIVGEPGGWKAWEGTICHEVSHTQMVNESTKWGSVNIVYGGDGGHWVSELIGEQELTFEEGLGTFFGLIDNPDWTRRALIPFFRNAGERYDLESWSVLAGTSEIWNAPHSESRQTPPTPPPTPGGQYAVRSYTWRNVPGFFVLFNENTSTAFHYFYWNHANGNRDSALDMILKEASTMSQHRRKRNLAYAVNRLSLQLEDFAATPAGATAKTNGTLTSSMYPFALLDVLTHFGMSEADYKREHRANNPDRSPKAFADYWSRRNAVKQLVDPHLTANPIRIEEAVRAVHDYFRAPATILATGP